MKHLGSVLACVLLTGCAHGVLGTLPQVDPAQAAEIIVIRPSGFVGCGSGVPITVDGHDVYGLGCGEYIVLTVPAGERIIGVKHWGWIRVAENTIALNVAARSRYYLHLETGPSLNRITEETGRALIAKIDKTAKP